MDFGKADTDIEKIKLAVLNGATLTEQVVFRNTIYWIVYPEGGTHRITKRIYDIINQTK